MIPARNLLLHFAVTALIASVLAGCRQITADGPSSAPAALPADAATIAAGEAEQPLIDAALAQIAAEVGLEPSDLQLVGFETVEWPDASLGCPQPDMMYAQVVTPGYRLTVTAGDRTLDVHTDAQVPPQVVICAP